MASFTVQQLNPEEIHKLDMEYHDMLGDRKAMRVAWQEMHAFFDQNEDADRLYWDSYFKWYTDLTWRQLMNMSPEMMGAIVFRRQIPMALLLDINVLRELMYFLYIRPLDSGLLTKLYEQVQAGFLGSDKVIGRWKEQEVTIADLVDDVEKTNLPNIDSLELADTKSKIENMLFPKDTDFALAEPAAVVAQFTSLVNFFLDVQSDKIEDVVTAFIRPDRLEAMTLGQKALEAGDNKEKQGFNLNEVKRIVDKKFLKDAAGQYIDTQGVLTMLDGLAVSYKDDRIRELFVFNEQSGGFEWNSALVTN